MSTPGALTALVLAGSRGPDEPLARYAGVTHKALIEIEGQSMLERVCRALAEVAVITRIVVVIERPELLDELPGLRSLRVPVIAMPAAAGPSASVAAGLRAEGTPLLVTTADHALLQAAWIEQFLGRCPAEADAIVALARRETVEEAVPATKRTWLRFADGAYSGCNLFFFATPAAARVVAFWQSIEAQRKKPLRMLAHVGWRAVLHYLTGRLRSDEAMRELSARCSARCVIVELSEGRAAVDVDKPADLDLVRALLGEDAAAAD